MGGASGSWEETPRKIKRKPFETATLLAEENQPTKYRAEELEKIADIPGNEPRRPKPEELKEPEKPKRSILVEGLKIAGQGLESYAHGRLGEEESETQEKYEESLRGYNRLRYEALKKKKSEGKLTDKKEIEEYIKRGGSMVGREEEEIK